MIQLQLFSCIFSSFLLFSINFWLSQQQSWIRLRLQLPKLLCTLYNFKCLEHLKGKFLCRQTCKCLWSSIRIVDKCVSDCFTNISAIW